MAYSMKVGIELEEVYFWPSEETGNLRCRSMNGPIEANHKMSAKDETWIIKE